jgi:hypothetical protein
VGAYATLPVRSAICAIQAGFSDKKGADPEHRTAGVFILYVSATVPHLRYPFDNVRPEGLASGLA